MKGFDDMKKIYEILSGIGLTVTDEQKKDFEKNFKEAYTSKADFDRLTAESDNYKSQLETAQTALQKFDGIDVDNLKNEIQKLTADLQKKEKDHAISPNMNEGHLFASDIYKSLFLEKIFGGLKERFLQASQENEQNGGKKLKYWLDEDLAKCVEQKKEEMTKITRGLVKDMKYPIEDTVISELWLLIKSRWIDRLFNTKGEEKQRELLQNAWKNMSYYGTLGKALNPIIRQVISEQPKEKDDESEADESVDDD